ncbi:MAG: alpha/beta hydrolase [Deltaproteobacteria bacterium]|nr:alpha/beta hydrolase [Deltaproteobacteria bacterium]
MQDISIPSMFNLLRQPLGFLELTRLIKNYSELIKLPKGNKEVVLVWPGFGTGDQFTSLLRLYLKKLNYQVHGWGLGFNHGNAHTLFPKVQKQVEHWAHKSGQAISIIGWSLGGFMAREIARDNPDKVKQVITLGSPVVGGPKYSALSHIYRWMGHDLDDIEKNIDKRNEKLIQVPVTAIYSKSDGVLAWQICVDTLHKHVIHHEVKTSHLGLGFAPEVYQIIAETLAKKRQSQKKKKSSNKN